MKHWVHSVSRKLVSAVLVLAVMAALPTGWFRDLWAGTGTEQGQKPGAGVEVIRRQEDIEAFFLFQAPVTVPGGELRACPLARLRNVGQEGLHARSRHGVRRSVYVSEYVTADYPIPTWQRLLRGAIGGFYNRYYLMELGDNSWLCVCFDDYLMLTGTEEYPVGYVRYTTTEERRMLNQMTEDTDVSSAYVLDMYRRGRRGMWQLRKYKEGAPYLAPAQRKYYEWLMRFK